MRSGVGFQELNGSSAILSERRPVFVVEADFNRPRRREMYKGGEERKPSINWFHCLIPSAPFAARTEYGSAWVPFHFLNNLASSPSLSTQHRTCCPRSPHGWTPLATCLDDSHAGCGTWATSKRCSSAFPMTASNLLSISSLTSAHLRGVAAHAWCAWKSVPAAQCGSVDATRTP